MNISGLLGLIAGIGLIVYGMIGQGDPLSGFINYPSLAITLGGTFAALLMSFPMSIIKNVPKMIMMVIKPKKYNPQESINQMVEYAKIARSKSLLALEESANECKEPFMKSSLMLIVDANDSDRVKEMLDSSIDFMCERHSQNIAFFDKTAAVAPGFGMIGTLVGLINMLANLEGDSSGLGAGMSTALITTFYGCIVAHLLASPIAHRLRAIHESEILCMEIIKEGSLAIISGANPRYIQEKLEFMLPKNKGKNKVKNQNKNEKAE